MTQGQQRRKRVLFVNKASLVREEKFGIVSRDCLKQLLGPEKPPSNGNTSEADPGE
jgi:hypothetical protein